MSRFNPVQRLLRRCGILRRFALIDLQRVRKTLADARWAYEHSILASVGLLVGTWSGVERQVNTLIAQYHPHRSPTLAKSKLPRLMQAKIPYLADMAEDQRLPELLRHEIKAWIPELDRLSKHRNLIIHGNVYKRKNQSFQWRVQDYDLRGHTPVFEEHSFGNDDLNAYVSDMATLSSRIADILHPLLFGLERPARAPSH